MPATRRKPFPIVALVGRANVGKSTLWNRLTDTGRALVSSVPHTTRDRNYAPVVWRGECVQAIDTGGLDAERSELIGKGILEQTDLAIREADIVLFLVDAKAGIVPQDQELARGVQRLNPHVMLVANKTDNARYASTALSKDAWSLGLGTPIACSASTGRGVGDLLDRLYEELQRLGKPPLPTETSKNLRLVVMGRPNVGKSSLVNAILGEERAITSPIAHTTREPVDTELTWKGEAITLVDTAGMRKRSKIEAGLEEHGIERNRQALLRADVAFLVLDATEEPKDQDKHLAGLLADEHKGLVIVANKWDLVKDKNTNTTNDYELRLRRAFPFLRWAPIVFTSALTKQRATALLDLAFTIREERRRQITYNALQKFLKSVIAKKKPLPASGPQSPYIHDVTQIGIEPPTFLITVRGQKANLHPSWLGYFENRLREKFNFAGTSIVIKARILPLVRDEMPEHLKNRPTRRKKPMGRRVGRY